MGWAPHDDHCVIQFDNETWEITEIVGRLFKLRHRTNRYRSITVDTKAIHWPSYCERAVDHIRHQYDLQ